MKDESPHRGEPSSSTSGCCSAGSVPTSTPAAGATAAPSLPVTVDRATFRVFETYWTNYRGVEAMDNSYALMDLTAYGRQEPWEDSPPGWPQPWRDGPTRIRTNGRPIAQWSRLEAGRSDDLAARTT